MSRIVSFAGGELRYQERPGGGEELDELIAKSPQSVHVEVMNDSTIWMGIDLEDGTHVRCSFYARNGRSHVEYMAEVEPPRPEGS